MTGRGSMRNEVAIAGDIEQADEEIERMFERSEVFPAGTDSRSRGDRSPR